MADFQDLSIWISIFNQQCTDSELVTNYKDMIEQSTVYATNLALDHGRFDLAYEMLDQILKTNNYELKTNEIDLLILQFPNNRMKKVIDICDNHKYKWKLEYKFVAVLRTYNEEYIDDRITTEKLAFRDQYTSVPDYCLILERGNLSLAMRYYDKISKSIYTFMRIRSYLTINYLSRRELAEKPSLLEFLCKQKIIIKLMEGPYIQRLRHIIKKWGIIIIDGYCDKEDKIYSFAYNIEEKALKPLPKKLEDGTTDDLSYETIKNDELYVSCSRHTYTFNSIRDYIITYEGNSSECPYCFERIRHNVYINQ